MRNPDAPAVPIAGDPTEDSPEITVEHRPPWKLALRLTVSIALLTLLLSKIPLSAALPRQPQIATLVWFSAGIACSIVAILGSAWRWQLAFAVFDRHVPIRTLTSHTFAGQFVGNVLPSTIGGDVLRVTRGGTSVQSRPLSFAAVVLERLTGFIALPFIAFTGLALTPSLFEHHGGWDTLAIGVGALVALGAIVALVGSRRLGGRFRHHTDWKQFLGALHEGLAHLRRKPRRGLELVGAALVYQLTTVAVVYCAVRTIDAPVGFTVIMAFAPAVAMAQVLPLSLSGLGVREGMLVLLLGSVGVSTGAAIGVGLCWYACTLIASLVGAPPFAFGGRKRQRT